MKSDDATREARWARVHEAEAKAKADINRITGELLDSLAADPDEIRGYADCPCGGRLAIRYRPEGAWKAKCSRIGCGSKYDRNPKRAARSAVAQAVNLYRLTH
jgi:hypothetical protein